jgi:hypothetical protein
MLLGALITMGMARAASAQAQPADPIDAAMDALRTRVPSGDQDIAVIDEWIDRQTESLFADPQDRDVAEQFRLRFAAEMGKEGNTPEFVDRVAARCAVKFSAAFADGTRLAPPAARALAWVLSDCNRVDGMDGLAAGLGLRERADVRYLCAKGFVALRQKIGVDPVLQDKALGILKQAGLREENGLVVAAIYEALQPTEPARRAEALAAILDILTARMERRRQSLPICDGAELQLLQYFKDNEPAAPADKERLVGLLAVMLRLDVDRFMKPDVGETEQIYLAHSITLAEEVLASIVFKQQPGQAPSIREALKKDAAERTLEMQIALNDWIGTADTAGKLNAVPWRVPAGAP